MLWVYLFLVVMVFAVCLAGSVHFALRVIQMRMRIWEYQGRLDYAYDSRQQQSFAGI